MYTIGQKFTYKKKPVKIIKIYGEKLCFGLIQEIETGVSYAIMFNLLKPIKK